MAQLNNAAQQWSDLQDVIAAYTSFQKYLVQLLCHIAIRAPLVINSYDMELRGSMGAKIKKTRS